MKKIKKIIIVLLSLFLITGCNEKKETNEFQELFDVDTTLVKSIIYEDFLNTNSLSGVVFIADETKEAKEIAKIFCEALCECDTDKALFLKKSKITDDKYKDMLNIEEIEDLLIVAFKKGNVIGTYSKETETDDIKEYLTNLIYEANPPVCNEFC